MTSEWSIHSMESLDKGMIRVWVGQCGMAGDFIMLLGMACNLKLMNRLHLEFSG